MNPEQKDTLTKMLTQGLQKSLDDAKVPQRYHLKVVEALRLHMLYHKQDMDSWHAALEKFSQERMTHEQRNLYHDKQVHSYKQELERYKQLQKGDPGNAGYTPQKGIDYFDGESPDLEDVVKALIPHIPPALEGKPGKNAEFEEGDILDKLIEKIKKEKPLDMSHVKGATDFIMNTSQKNVKIKFEELMHGGRASSNGGNGYQQPTSGAVDGSNQVFVWATAPNVIIVDQGRPMQKVSSDGTINWTGTTTTTLAVAPNFDIFASA